MATSVKAGTLTISDLQAVNDVSILEFGESTIAEVVQRDLENFNRVIEEQISFFAMPETDKSGRLKRYGTSVTGDMVELDEHGRPPAQKAKPGVNVGFPLKKYGFAVGWTRDYMLNRTPADVAVTVTTTEMAYRRRLQHEMRRALYLASNYTFVDRLVDQVSLPVKRFVNADSAQIPDSPNGASFDGSTHTHYVANNGWDNTTLKAAVTNLTEHGHTDRVVMVIDSSDETAVRALTDFDAYPDPRIVFRSTDTPGQTLDLGNTGNRAIGVFSNAEVWVKPWAIADYALITAIGDPEKPLVWRQHHEASARGLRLAYEMDEYPLRADTFEAYMGFGVWGRTNGVIYFAGAGAYADPTITT